MCSCSIRCPYRITLVMLSVSFVNVLLMTLHNVKVDRFENITNLVYETGFAESTRGNNSSKVEKTILLWNAQHRPETLLFGAGEEVFRQHGCEYVNCKLTTSRWQMHQPLELYDAVVFNIIDDFWKSQLPKPQQRSPHQRYVFFTLESPAALKNYDEVVYKAKFNWTMTYRHNSDIRFLYGRISPKGLIAPKSEDIQTLIQTASYKNVASSKTKLLAWMASKCVTSSKREHYVKELQKHIQVDIYGSCGKLRCAKHELLPSHPKCYDMLEHNYKFYLSFENAICRDYVTEKFFSIIQRDIVPVVFGGANYEKLAPPHSYIDARKYEPEQLARYLKMLDSNDTLYNEFFWWKHYYKVEAGIGQMVRHGFCDLCKKLHQDDKAKMYRGGSLISQWSTRSSCQKNLGLSLGL